jgi:transcriptional regulator with XRE-family HTH domain
MSDQLAQTIGKRVQFYRTASKRTKTVVAGLTGITPDYLYQIERGQTVPTLAVLTQLADVLRVPVADLLGDQPAPETRQVGVEAAAAIYRALTDAILVSHEPRELPILRRRVNAAWHTWQTSPSRYSQITERLPSLITDIELALQAMGAEQSAKRRAAYGCAADLYGLLRTVTKRFGRVDLSLLAADRAVRSAQIADDPFRLAAAHWNMAQVLVANSAPDAAQALVANSAEQVRPLMNKDRRATALEAVAATRKGDAWGARELVQKAVPLAAKTANAMLTGPCLVQPM